jgi:hypothetical protein
MEALRLTIPEYRLQGFAHIAYGNVGEALKPILCVK